MEKGAYIVHQNQDNPRDIVFSIKPDFQNKVPAVQEKLHLEIEKTLVVIQMLFDNDNETFEIYFNQLLTLAQAGLVSDNAQPTIALNALQQFKNEIVDKKSGEVKNEYFKALGLKALKLGVLPLVLSVLINILYYYFPDTKELAVLYKFANFMLVWSSCMLGVWLSFGARKTILKFEDLNILEEDRLEPNMRLLFAGFITLIFALLFSAEVLTVDIGNLSSISISTDSTASIIFGTFLGLSEQVLGKKITKKAASIFDNQ